jgi:hypothetical protein
MNGIKSLIKEAAHSILLSCASVSRAVRHRDPLLLIPEDVATSHHLETESNPHQTPNLPQSLDLGLPRLKNSDL